MSAIDSFGIHSDRISDLPMLAWHRDVHLVADLPVDWVPGLCGICPEPSDWGGFVPDGCMRVTHRREPGDVPRHTDVCGDAHADQEMAEVLRLREWWPLLVVELHVPASWAVPNTLGRAA